jgi:hypothetical protein
MQIPKLVPLVIQCGMLCTLRCEKGINGSLLLCKPAHQTPASKSKLKGRSMTHAALYKPVMRAKMALHDQPCGKSAHRLVGGFGSSWNL